MSETTLQLVPNGKPEFLARVGPLTPSSSSEKGGLPMTELHLDGYTRDAWANVNDNRIWKSIHLKSVDGRHKLPGFLKFLKQRQKSAYGRFASTPTGTRGIVLVPLQQSPPLSTNTSQDDDEIIFCRYVLDERTIPGFPHNAPSSSKSAPPPLPRQPLDLSKKAPPVQRRNIAAAPKQSTPSTTSVVSRGGMLGNLLGAQRRTNQHLAVVRSSRAKETPVVPTSTTATTTTTDSVGGVGLDGSAMTSGQVIARFRQSMEQRLLDFKHSEATTSIKINVSLPKIVSDLPNDQKGNITMDVLKYVVYEQAEEIGEDEWVASKEPSEFMDEAIIAVYKQGHAPADVMEDLMKGDLPDEVRGQERAMREARLKEQARKEAKAEKLRHKETVGKGHVMTVETLNTQKRDRRTIEEIQRDMIDGNNNQHGNKKPRMS